MATCDGATEQIKVTNVSRNEELEESCPDPLILKDEDGGAVTNELSMEDAIGMM